VAGCDSGRGIDPESLKRVFEAFHISKPSGTGMGLLIYRSIIDAYGTGCGQRRMNLVAGRP